MLIRCILKFETKKFFIGKTYSNRWYVIVKNQFNNHFKKGNDYNFFVDVEEGFLFDKLIPIDKNTVYKNVS